MAWPSGTKASTANLDQGTDLISQARPHIKQNVDNVNDIIDEFNIASPSDGDALEYNSTSGAWESVARGAGRISIFRFSDSFTSSGTVEAYTGDITIDLSNGSSLTKTSNGSDTTFISLDAGTYTFEIIGINVQGIYGSTVSVPEIKFNSVDSSSDANTEFRIDYSSAGFYHSIADFTPNLVTLASDTDLYIYYGLGSTNPVTSFTSYLKVTKVA